MSELRWERVRGGKHPEYILRAYETRVKSYVVGGVRMTSRKRGKWRVYENDLRYTHSDNDYFHTTIRAWTDEEAMDTARVLLHGFVR